MATSGRGKRAVAVLAKALAHPARVRILRILLARTTCTCGEVVAELADQEHGPAPRRQIQGDGAGQRRLADAALAGEEQHPGR